MKQIHVLVGCCVGALGMIIPGNQEWSDSLLLYARNNYDENVLTIRSPTRSGRSSGPMQRAQNTPDSTNSRSISPSGRHKDSAATDIQRTHQSPLRSHSPVERTQNMPSSTGTHLSLVGLGREGMTAASNALRSKQSPSQSPSSPRRSQENPSGASQGRGNTLDHSQIHNDPPGRHKTVVRGAVIGPARVDMKGEDGQRRSTYIPLGHGEFVSASGGHKQDINVETFHNSPSEQGEVSLGAEGQRAARMAVQAGQKGTGQIERKAPLPTWEKHVPPGRTNAEVAFARPPPQHQYLIGNLKGEGEVRAAAYSSQEPTE